MSDNVPIEPPTWSDAERFQQDLDKVAEIGKRAAAIWCKWCETGEPTIGGTAMGYEMYSAICHMVAHAEGTDCAIENCSTGPQAGRLVRPLNERP